MRYASVVERGALAAVLVSLALGIGCAAPATPRATVETFDATLQVAADGTVDVEEQMRVRLAEHATAFDRTIDLDRADAVQFLGATLDGHALTRDLSASTHVVVTEGRTLGVRWEFPVLATAPHILTLRYRARGVIEIHGTNGRVALTVLDPSRRFDVAEARLTLLPPGDTVLREGSGISEAGWTVARTGRGITGTRRELAPAETATAIGTLAIDLGQLTDPTWELNEERADQFMAAFLSGGAFVLIVGVGILWIVRFEHPRGRTGDEDERRLVRRNLRLGGLVSVAFSAAAGWLMWVTLQPYGVWPMAVPASILVVGFLFLALGGWIV